MSPWSVVLLALLLPSCALEPATQTLVQVSIDPALAPRLAWVDATFMDETWTTPGKSQRYLLTGDMAARLPLSFAGLPDDEGMVRIILRAYARDRPDQPLLEKRVEEHLQGHEKRHVSVVFDCSDPKACGAACQWPSDPGCPIPLGQLCGSDVECGSGICFRGTCCSERCAGECVSCDQPGFAGQCVVVQPPASPEHCGGCGQRCDTTHVAEPHCSEAPISSDPAAPKAFCDGACALNWGDCDDQRTHGCDVDLLSRADHCGRCEGEGSRCPFGVCSLGVCQSFPASGYSGGDKEVRWPPNRMFGVMAFAPETLHVAGLGIKLRHGGDYPVARVRLGLYRGNADRNFGERLGSTSELSTDPERWTDLGIVSVHGGIEQPIARVEIPAQSYYWLFFISDQPVYLVSQDYEDSWYATPEGALSYAGSSELPQFPPGDPLKGYGPAPRGAFYAVLVPPQTNN